MKVFKYAITNNFNDEIIFTSSTGQDLKNDVRFEAERHGKTEKDFKTNKI